MIAWLRVAQRVLAAFLPRWPLVSDLPETASRSALKREEPSPLSWAGFASASSRANAAVGVESVARRSSFVEPEVPRDDLHHLDDPAGRAHLRKSAVGPGRHGAATWIVIGFYDGCGSPCRRSGPCHRRTDGRPAGPSHSWPHVDWLFPRVVPRDEPVALLCSLHGGGRARGVRWLIRRAPREALAACEDP